MRDVVPINQLTRRLPTAGRLRMGKKGDKGQPVAIDTWRFTSEDEQAIREVATTYGGEVRPWQQQWEVVTSANEIAVVLPPDPLGDTPIYEAWTGGGCVRRCDGVRATVPGGANEPDPEPREVDCLCLAQENMVCKPTTHLSVLLPDVRFAGVWRLTSLGWNTAHEPGMVDMVAALQSRGLTRALLAIESRTSKKGGRTNHFKVPALRLSSTVNELAAGMGQVSALGRARDDVPALDTSDEVLEGEPMDDEGEVPEVDEAVQDAIPVDDDEVETISDGQRKRFMATVRDAGLDYELDVKPWMVDATGITSINDVPKATMGKWLDRFTQDDGVEKFVAACEKARQARIGQEEPATLGQRITALGLGPVDVIQVAKEEAKRLQASMPSKPPSEWSTENMHPGLHDALVGWVEVKEAEA